MKNQRWIVTDIDGQLQPVAESEFRLLQLAEVIRTMYYIEYNRYMDLDEPAGVKPNPRWDGGTDERGVNHKNAWDKLARDVVARRLNPVRLVRVAFRNSQPGKPPWPNTLTSAGTLKDYATHVENFKEEWAADWRRFNQSLKMRMRELRVFPELDEKARLVTALYDPWNVLGSPLFRFCVATQAGLPAVAAEFVNEAFLDYLFSIEEYDAAWPAGVIPQGLRDFARGVRRNLGYVEENTCPT